MRVAATVRLWYGESIDHGLMDRGKPFPRLDSNVSEVRGAGDREAVMFAIRRCNGSIARAAQARSMRGTVEMMQPTFADDDVFERALMRLLDPSRTAGARDDMPGATGWRRRACAASVMTAHARPPRRRLRIRIVEILSDTAVSVRWSDPRFGHFGEQLWHCVTARTASRCVLTGAPIKPGDRVYRPRGRGRTVPCNWDRMIHAAAVAPGLSASADGS